MLQIKSFDIKDGDGISKFLSEYTLAKDATILISNGYLAIPYEDGKPLTPSQKITLVKETMSIIQTKIDTVQKHKQRVLEVRIDGIQKQIDEQEEKKKIKIGDKKRDYDTEKAADKEIKRLQSMIEQDENSINMIQAEITDQMVELAVCGEEIGLLEQIVKDSE